MTDKEIERAIDAYRWVCPYHAPCKRLDGTYYHHSCFEWGSDKYNYKCAPRICKRLRRFINILKQPEQDSYKINDIDSRTEKEAYDRQSTENTRRG
jgi:hypothetical protein